MIIHGCSPGFIVGSCTITPCFASADTQACCISGVQCAIASAHVGQRWFRSRNQYFHWRLPWLWGSFGGCSAPHRLQTCWVAFMFSLVRLVSCFLFYSPLQSLATQRTPE